MTCHKRLPRTVRLYGKKYPLVWGEQYETSAIALVTDVLGGTEHPTFVRLRIEGYQSLGEGGWYWSAALAFSYEDRRCFTNCTATAYSMTAAVSKVVERMRARTGMLSAVHTTLHGEEG